MRKLTLLSSILLLVIPCAAESIPEGNLQSTTGPVPPQAVIERDREKAQEEPITFQVQQTITVPSYIWRHGCGPTAVGMIIGYYDGLGFDNLIPGDASTQTHDVNQAIASGGDYDNPNPPGFEEHYEDYARPEDYAPDMLDDDYITEGREPHTSNCIADFMYTSRSTRNNYYGWSWFDDAASSFRSYVSTKLTKYLPRTENYYMSSGTLWSNLTNEIDNSRPMCFLVDVDGDNETDHFVTVIGYRDDPTQQYGCFDTWYHTIRWEDFQAMGTGVPWGISAGISFKLELKPPEINVKYKDTDIMSIIGSHDFDRVGLGWSKDATFTIENLGEVNLVLTGSPFVEISGTNADDFVVTEQPSSLILPGEATTFDITFEPSATGLRNATVYIDSNDTDENPYRFSLKGTGTVAVTFYVDANAEGGNNGTSWTDAYNYLQDALADLVAAPSVGDKILVADGVYRPDDDTTHPDGTGDRSATFQLIEGVTIEGGYAGYGAAEPNFRNANLHPTILSGDLQENDAEISNPADLPGDPCRAENSYHVVTGSGADAAAVLDGFTISGGDANGSYPDYYGGGMYNHNDDYKSVGPTLINCRFYQNCASSRGGGLYSWNNSRARLINCLFIKNSSAEGGGMYVRDDICQPTLINCTFSENSASSAGGGILEANSASLTVTNCILWGNSVGAVTDESAQINSTKATVNYSCIQGLTGALGGTGNIGCDPCFANPCDDYHLKSIAGRWDPNIESWIIDTNTSSCIDSGNPGCPLGDEPNDVNNVRINMGAYGGTAEASKSPANWRSIADLTNDRAVDFDDLAVFADHWLDEGECIPSDLGRNQLVNLKDFAIFAENWLW